MVRKNFILAILIALTAGSPSLAEAPQVKQVRYKKLGLIGMKISQSGYKEKNTGPNTWKIEGIVPPPPFGKKGMDKNIAFYRAADLSSSTGKKYFQIIDEGHVQTYTYPYTFAISYILNIEVVEQPSRENHCDKDILEKRCKTVDAAAALREIRPTLIFKDKK